MLGKWQEMDGRQRVRFLAVRGALSIGGTFAAITATVSLTADDALEPLSWVADVQYSDTFWHMNGDIGINGLRITPFQGDASETISVDRITVHTPGFIWLARASTASPEERTPGVLPDGSIEPSLPPMDRLGVTIEGLRFAAQSYLPEHLSWVGLDSAAPFEAAGCGTEDYFSPGELEDMGLPDTRQHMTVMLEAASYDVVRMSVELVTPEVSSIRIERTERTENAERWITSLAEAIPPGEGRHIETLVKIEDAGFVKARNAACAKRLSITPAQFVERHMAAVKRLALVYGAVPDESILAAYRDFATNGGKLELSSRPMTEIPEEDWDQFSQADQLKLRNVTWTRNGRSQPLAMSFVVPQPLPSSDAFVAMEQELTAELELERSLAANFGARGATARAKRAPKPTEALAAQAPPVPVSRSGQDLRYEELKDFVGRKVRVNTQQFLGQLATVEKFSDKSVVLRVHFTGGTATYELPRESLRRIVAM